MSRNVFSEYEPLIYKYRYAGAIKVGQLMGGTPSDDNVAAGWLKSKMGGDKEEVIKEMVAEVMRARNVGEDEAVKEIDIRRHLNGFKREEDGVLYIEGRHLKACAKEAASAARAVNNLPARMGATSKGMLAFVAEHIVVVEEVLRLGRFDPVTGKVVDVTKPTGIVQSFPKNAITKQTGIQYTEFVRDAVVEFTIHCDYEFSELEWATIWLTGGNQGIGASRSQNYGRFVVTKWERLK